MSQPEEFEGWGIAELMGHRMLAGYCRSVSLFGANMLRIDVPESDDAPAATQYYSAAALFSLTPTTEDMARRIARSRRPQPVSPWELPPAPPPLIVTEPRPPRPPLGYATRAPQDGPDDYDPTVDCDTDDEPEAEWN